MLTNLRCLAHIINLAMQALISTHSKSKHYNPAEPDVDLAAARGSDCDEVGLVRAICVKVRLGDLWILDESLISFIIRHAHLQNASKCSPISRYAQQ
jgi:hypothetical protein